LQRQLMTDTGLDLAAAIFLAWRSRWLIIIVTAMFGVAAVIYSLLATEWYRTDVVLLPVERRSASTGLSQLSGLASLAGISVGQSGGQEALAVLRSKDYAREFIKTHDLVSVLSEQGGSKDGPIDDRQALRVFEELVRTVEFDRKSGLVTLTMRWTDPNTVAKWANDYVVGVNERMRLRALQESEQNVAFLNREVASATVVSMQQSIGRVLESEMQKLMLAKGNTEFAFKVIDPSFPPDRRYSPRRTLTVLLAMVFGGIFAVVFVLVREAYRGPNNGRVIE
jgi:uncharacterized protein involved in exopolysaccharide biosynthesis